MEVNGGIGLVAVRANSRRLWEQEIKSSPSHLVADCVVIARHCMVVSLLSYVNATKKRIRSFSTCQVCYFGEMISLFLSPSFFIQRTVMINECCLQNCQAPYMGYVQITQHSVLHIGDIQQITVVTRVQFKNIITAFTHRTLLESL